MLQKGAFTSWLQQNNTKVHSTLKSWAFGIVDVLGTIRAWATQA